MDHPSQQLADAVFSMDDTSPKLSRDSLRRIIHLAYEASLLEEEGRLPKFSMICTTDPLGPGDHRDALRTVVTLGEGISIATPDDIRRLSPIADRHRSALIVTERDGEWYCLGTAEFPLAVHRYGSLEVGSVSWTSNLCVGVDGPGRMSAGLFSGPSYLRAGVVHTPAPMFPEVPMSAGAALNRRLKDTRNPHLSEFDDFRCAMLLLDLLSHIVSMSAKARHGGTFVVTDSQAGMERGHQASFNLVEAIEERLEFTVELSPELFDAVWERLRHDMFGIAEHILGLSMVDGCVVFDSRFELQQFGVRLSGDDECELPDALRGTGTRHQSAYRFCASRDETFAYVVSQDGNTTVIGPRKDEYVPVMQSFDHLHWMSLR